MKKIFTENKNEGFALLFTVLVISIILAIALGISDVTYKQSLLSSAARDSQLAFYQADSGVECGMYITLKEGYLPRGTAVTSDPATGQAGANESFSCGGNTIALVPLQSRTDYLVYQEELPSSESPNDPCYSITFDKTGTKNIVSARGYSTCAQTAQQVERGLEVQY